jgi:hypothetical protein
MRMGEKQKLAKQRAEMGARGDQQAERSEVRGQKTGGGEGADSQKATKRTKGWQI